MYNGAIALQGLSIAMVAVHDLLDRIEGESSDRLLILAVVLQVAVVASLLGFRAILIANHNHEQHMRADPKPRAGARPSCSR
jgi:diguanylate cyclase